MVSQRNTLAIDHHHPLCTLAPLGFADSSAPFFTEAKLPSINASLQSNKPLRFSSPRNVRQIVSHTSCSSQSCSRRQHVAGEGYSAGRSCHLAPLRAIHKMPSSTRPSYLVQARHMALMKAGIFTSVPYVIAVICSILFAKYSDKILTPEAVEQGKRCTAVAVSVLLSSVVLLTTVVSNEFVVLLLIPTSLTFTCAVTGLNTALVSDLVRDPRMVGSATGVLILGGNTFGLAASIVTGIIVKASGNFDSAYFLAGGLLLVGVLICMTMTRKPLTFKVGMASVKVVSQ